MNEPQPPLLPDSPPPSGTSLFARLTDVFVSPGRVFDEIKASPPNSANWLVPLALACVLGVVSVWVMFSQETVLHSVRETQQRALQKQVAAGKVPKEQADKIVEMSEGFMNPAMLRIFGSLGAVSGSVVMLFVVALVVWLLGTKVFKGTFDYLRAVEACGVAAMINVLGGVVTMLLVVIKGSLIASLSPALFISELDVANPAHRALAAINLLTLWYVGVVAVALERLSGASFAKAAGWLYGLWAILAFGGILVSIGFSPP